MNPNQRLIIRNRAALASAEGWIHIVPKGELPNAEAKIVQVLDDASLDSILAGIQKDKNRMGDKWPGIYAGREHFIYDSDKDSAALGWFKDFEKRADGIWAKEDGLTPGGVTAVKNREYKFTSFVADPADLQKVEGNKYRVMKIETVGFTNYANGRELLTPITNRNNFPGVSASAANVENNNQEKRMKKIADKLGLAAEASEDAILAEVTKIMNRVTELEPLADENTKLKNRIAAADSVAVDTLLATHKVTDAKVLNRLKPIIAALPTQEERVAALVDFGYKVETAPASTARVLNRQPAPAAGATGADERDTAQKIRNRAMAIQGERKCSFDSAWAEASREITAK
jgi:phage I-like protein